MLRTDVDKGRQGVRKAIIIGVSEYNNEKLRPLDFCRKNGEEMYQILKSLGYEIADNHKLIGKVNYVELRDGIIKFFIDKKIKSKDTLLFYFSGHGIPEDNGELYLATSEIDPEKPFVKGFSFEDLQRMMDRSVSTRKVIILDCCYSGAARVGK